jgi:hypothetical protein
MDAADWVATSGLVVLYAFLAVLLIRHLRRERHRSAERRLADDVEAWLRDRQKA